MNERQYRMICRIKTYTELCIIKEPPGQLIQSLLDEGYCRLTKVLSGPLRQATGERCIKINDKGEDEFQNYENSVKIRKTHDTDPEIQANGL